MLEVRVVPGAVRLVSYEDPTVAGSLRLGHVPRLVLLERPTSYRQHVNDVNPRRNKRYVMVWCPGKVGPMVWPGNRYVSVYILHGQGIKLYQDILLYCIP